MNAELDWEPVDKDEDGGDELPRFDANENHGSCVLHVLAPGQGFSWNSRPRMYEKDSRL